MIFTSLIIRVSKTVPLTLYLDIPTRSLSVESQSVFAPLAPLEHSCPPPVNLHTLQLQDPDISVIIPYLETTALPTDDAKA